MQKSAPIVFEEDVHAAGMGYHVAGKITDPGRQAVWGTTLDRSMPAESPEIEFLGVTTEEGDTLDVSNLDDDLYDALHEQVCEKLGLP